jgi:hypothetical protein
MIVVIVSKYWGVLVRFSLLSGVSWNSPTVGEHFPSFGGRDRIR